MLKLFNLTQQKLNEEIYISSILFEKLQLTMKKYITRNT